MKILISDPDGTAATKAKNLFEKNQLQTLVCQSGKDCQLHVYKDKIDCVLLDLDTDNYPGLMVLKYMRLNHSSVKVVLTLKSKKYLTDMELNVEDLKKLGASSVLIKPFSDDLLLKSVQGDQYDSWKKLKPNDLPLEEEKVTLEKDEEFTRVKIETCKSGNVTIFDHYIRLGPGRFIKVLRKGDFFDSARVGKYIEEKKVDYLYFKTKERTVYINFMNEMMKKIVASGKASTSEVISSIKVLSEMYIEELYTAGLKPQLIDEGQKICQSMYKFVKTDGNLAKHIKDLQEQDQNGHGHLFLVSFFSTIICKNLEWSSERTVETAAMGGLLHDIGKLKLPLAIRNLTETEVPQNQLALFRQHPILGLEMLSKSSVITEPVKQIVSQHHEHVNGLGYPNALPGSKIYPLAKVVALADAFAELITSKKISPIEGLKVLVTNKEETAKYDAMAIKALVMGLIK